MQVELMRTSATPKTPPLQNKGYTHTGRQIKILLLLKKKKVLETQSTKQLQLVHAALKTRREDRTNKRRSSLLSIWNSYACAMKQAASAKLPKAFKAFEFDADLGENTSLTFHHKRRNTTTVAARASYP